MTVVEGADKAVKKEQLPPGVRHIAVNQPAKEVGTKPETITSQGWVDAASLHRYLTSQLRDGEDLCADTSTLDRPELKWVGCERITADGVEYLVIFGGEQMVEAICIYQNQTKHGPFNGFYAIARQPRLV